MPVFIKLFQPAHIGKRTAVNKGCAADRLFCKGTAQPGAQILRHGTFAGGIAVNHRGAQHADILALKGAAYLFDFIKGVFVCIPLKG